MYVGIIIGERIYILRQVDHFAIAATMETVAK